MTDTFTIAFDEITIRKDSVTPAVFASILTVAKCDGDDSEIYIHGELVFRDDGLGGTMFYGVKINGGELYGEAYAAVHSAAEVQYADEISDNVVEAEDDCPDEAQFHWNAGRGSVRTYGGVR